MRLFTIADCQRNEQGHLVAQRRDGKQVRIVCTDAAGEFPIRGLCRELNAAGGEYDANLSWTKEGYIHRTKRGQDWDLVPAKGKKVGWVNIYEGDADKVEKNGAIAANIFASQQRANSAALMDRLACIRIEWEE